MQLKKRQYDLSGRKYAVFFQVGGDTGISEYVVAVNVETGEEISVEKGNLYRMPDGSFWLV